jgi:thymidylate kinase
VKEMAKMTKTTKTTKTTVMIDRYYSCFAYQGVARATVAYH